MRTDAVPLAVIYEGPAVEAGEMDVRDLAPALLGVATLFEAANQELYGERARLRVLIKAASAGSFEVDLSLVQIWATWMTELLTGPGIGAILNVKELVIGGDGAAVGLIALIKKLRGKPPKIVETGGREVIIETANGDRITIPAEVWRLYLNHSVHNALESSIAKPLAQRGLDAVEFRDGRSQLRIASDEGEWFKALPFEEVVVETRHRRAFTIVHLYFKEGRKWRLYDGEREYAVEIEEDEFLHRVDRGEERFGKGEILICNVAIRQVLSKGRLRTEVTVERVCTDRVFS